MSNTGLRAMNTKVKKLTLVNKLDVCLSESWRIKRPCFDIYNPIKVTFSHKEKKNRKDNLGERQWCYFIPYLRTLLLRNFLILKSFKNLY